MEVLTTVKLRSHLGFLKSGLDQRIKEFWNTTYRTASQCVLKMYSDFITLKGGMYSQNVNNKMQGIRME